MASVLNQLKKIITDYGFKWVLDVNHIYTHDKTMKLVDQFIAELGIPAHIHLSGYDETLLHTVIHDKHQEIMIKAVSGIAPIIIESDLRQA